jgi:hypothetical protein
MLPTKKLKAQKTRKRVTENQNLYKQPCPNPLRDKISVQISNEKNCEPLDCKSNRIFSVLRIRCHSIQRCVGKIKHQRLVELPPYNEREVICNNNESKSFFQTHHTNGKDKSLFLMSNQPPQTSQEPKKIDNTRPFSSGILVLCCHFCYEESVFISSFARFLSSP